jgi:glucans biosynthesis protein
MAQERFVERFDRAVLLARAADLAKQAHVPPAHGGGGEQQRLTYDQYRSIRFQPANAIWLHENRNFAVDLYYPGFIFDTPVNVNLVVGKTARQVLFRNDLFNYSPEVPIDGSEHSAYSGFRVRAPLNDPDRMDEFLAFQGASYFRAVAREQHYGVSARGIAVRTARPEGEEFPAFTDFWIERPPEQAERITIHALLQSPSVVGAYTFVAQPGDETIIDMQVTLFPRVDLTAFGVAPLTSMFLFDASNRVRFDDYRNAVHDSDGLQILNGAGERLWRPLANPRALQVSAFVDDSPKGFGLLQRKRQFSDYEDAEELYDRHPSVWVEPKTPWGPGHVELVEIPSDREMNDNIVAYWQPRTPIAAGQSAEFTYRLRFTTEPLDHSLARVTSTRIGQSRGFEGQRSFVIDFAPADPAAIPEGLEPEIRTSSGEVLAPRGQVVPESGVYRASFELDPQREGSAELRAVLLHEGKPWSETWLYRWSR